MANPEHLAVLKQGAKVWNRWREENLGEYLDFRKANLANINLAGAKLFRANLSDANLSGAYLVDINLVGSFLSGANLAGADVRGAILRGASLQGINLSGANLADTNLAGAYLNDATLVSANLKGADLWQTSLGGANLNRANLASADLRGAMASEINLKDANLQGARLFQTNLVLAELQNAILNNAKIGYTVFGRVDLRGVLGLETVSHEAPSIIGIDTLYKSKGNIPETFLRGCGVPDQMIEYARSFTGSPIEYYSCFISYSSEDEEFAKRVHNDLQAAGVRCWFAPHDMKIGDKIRPTIDESIRVHDKTLLILSEHSVQSDWVEHEVEHALDIEKEKKKNVLFPVRVDEAVMESKTGWAGNVRRQRHIGDFTKWKDHDAYSKAFDRLLRDLKAG